MASIDIQRSHTHGKPIARVAVERVVEAIAKEYGVEHRWSGDELHFTRAGVNGRIDVAEDVVRVHVELGFLTAAFKPVIEREIERQLDKYIA